MFRTTPWTSSLSLQWRYGINQCERLLRVIAVCTGELDSQRNSVSVRKSSDACCRAWLGQWDSAPSVAPKNRPHRTAIYYCSGPIDLSVACQPVQQSEVDQLPDARPLPVA